MLGLFVKAIMNLFRHWYSFLLLISLLGSLLPPRQACGDDLSVNYLYNLSDFNGIVPYNGARISPDQYSEDILVINGNRVDIYNGRGMEVFDFFMDYAAIFDLAVEPGGDIISFVPNESTPSLVRCNYRGEFKAEYRITGLPAEFANSSFSSMRYSDKQLYFVDMQGLVVVVTDLNGVYLRGYDAGPKFAAAFSAKQFQDISFGGLGVDQEGNMFFTLPNAGSAAKLSADGTLTCFGARGSGPGKLGIPGAIAVDRNGYIYVCDKLRSMVLVYDKKLKFVTEFGNRGFYGGNLIIPVSIAVARDGRIYVGQLLDRGVNVYKVNYN